MSILFDNKTQEDPPCAHPCARGKRIRNSPTQLLASTKTFARSFGGTFRSSREHKTTLALEPRKVVEGGGFEPP